MRTRLEYGCGGWWINGEPIDEECVQWRYPSEWAAIVAEAETDVKTAVVLRGEATKIACQEQEWGARQDRGQVYHDGTVYEPMLYMLVDFTPPAPDALSHDEVQSILIAPAPSTQNKQRQSKC